MSLYLFKMSGLPKIEVKFELPSNLQGEVVDHNRRSRHSALGYAILIALTNNNAA